MTESFAEVADGAVLLLVFHIPLHFPLEQGTLKTSTKLL